MFIDKLDLSSNPLGLEGTLAVGTLMVSHDVDLSRCKLTTGLPNTDSLNAGISISGETVRDVGQQLCQMPQNDVITRLVLDGNSFTGEGIHILAGFMHLCPCLEYLITIDCGITSDDFLLLLDKLTQFKCSCPGLCSQLYAWNLNENTIDDNGVHKLISYLPSLFPSIPCSKCDPDFCFSLDGNPVSSDVESELEEEFKKLCDCDCVVRGCNFNNAIKSRDN